MITLPKGYLSYSAYDLWRKNKDAFRRRYYLNERPVETVETIYGKQAHKELEESGTVSGSETKMEVMLGEIKLLGYIDSLDPTTYKIIDFKFGHLDKNGNPPWDKVKVHKHKQLIFYCMMCELQYGTFNPWTELHWYETRFKEKCVEFGGHKMCAQTRELERTGKVAIFKRRVCKWEIEKIKQDVLTAASEISEDYQSFLQTSSSA